MKEKSLYFIITLISALAFISCGPDDDRLPNGYEGGLSGVRNFDFYHWVSFAFKFYSVIALASRTRKEHIAVGHILKYDGAIVFWMNTFFHFC